MLCIGFINFAFCATPSGELRQQGQMQRIVVEQRREAERRHWAYGNTSAISEAVLQAGGFDSNPRQIQGGQILLIAQAMVENPSKIHMTGAASVRSNGGVNKDTILALSPVKIHSARKIANAWSIKANVHANTTGSLPKGVRIASDQNVAMNLDGDLDNAKAINSGAGDGIRTEHLLNPRHGVNLNRLAIK